MEAEEIKKEMEERKRSINKLDKQKYKITMFIIDRKEKRTTLEATIKIR